METTKPHPPILEFANEYLKANARVQAKLRRINVETREEKLIPKPSVVNAQKPKSKRSNDQLLDSDDDDSDTEFKTKLDPEPEDIDNDDEDDVNQPAKSKKNPKLKRKLEVDEKVTPGKGKAKGKNKKSKKQRLCNETEAQDELVDLELSD